MWILSAFRNFRTLYSREWTCWNIIPSAYPPVYKGTLAQAMEERDVDAYLDSRKLNLIVRKQSKKQSENFDGLHLEEEDAQSKCWNSLKNV